MTKFKIGALVEVKPKLHTNVLPQLAIIIEFDKSYYQVFLQCDMRIFPLLPSEIANEI